MSHCCFGELFLIPHPHPQPLPIGNELDGAILICAMCIDYRYDVGCLTTFDGTC